MDASDGGKTGADMVDFALKKGIIIRPQSAMYSRDGWFRITIGSAEENRMVVDAIKEFMAS
jgi:histidinol-phosphate/aromatic aminotransferase/cobyric acid decarboxylase-like protein